MGVMPRKKIVEPFSVFKPSAYNRWVIKFNGKQYKTGLEATAYNRNKAAEIGWRLYYDDIKNNEVEQSISRHITFAQSFDNFLKNYAINASVKTKEAYKRAFSVIIPDAMTANKPVSEATILHHVKAAILRNRQIRNGWDVYRRAFVKYLNWCVEQKYIASVPDISPYFPKPTPKKIQIFTNEEFTQIFEYFQKKDKEFSVLLLLLASTGLRIHEALLLKLSDIQQNTIHVISKDGKRAETAIVSDDVLVALQSLPQRKSKKVFRWELISVSRLRKRFYVAMDDLGIIRNGRSFHELRKTFISIMANADIDVRTASRLARCDIKVMMKHYTVLSTETVQIAAETIAKKLNKTNHTANE
jgi:integrase